MRNAFQRSFGARLEKTSRAPARFAARSCDVRPELSKTITSGRNDSIVASTCGVLLVGEASQSMIGKFTDSRNTAWRLTRKRMSAAGICLREFARDDQAPHQFAGAAGAGYRREQHARGRSVRTAPVNRGVAANPDSLPAAAGADDSTAQYACSMRAAVCSRLNSDRSDSIRLRPAA